MTNYNLNGETLPQCFDPSLLPSIENYYRPYLAKAKGSKSLILCPFHHEKTASLSPDLATGRFYCFGCGVSGGDIVDFHQRLHGFTFLQAITDLGANVRKNETPQEQAARQQRINAHEKNRQQQRQLAEQQAQADAQAFIVMIESLVKHHATPPMLTPYCEAKSIQPHNLLAIEASTLHRIKHPLDSSKTLGYGLTGLLTVALLHTLDGQLVALQVFDGVADDKGKFARRYIGRPFYLGGYYFLGDWITPNIVLIVEGVADAVTVFEATGYPALAAGSKNQLLAAALAVRKKHPHAVIVMVADNDLDGSGQRAAHDAANAVNGLVVIPLQDCKDSNDIAKTHGLQAVKKMIDDAVNNHDENHTEPQENEDAAIERLSKLSAIDYERLRLDESKKLNIRATVLDKLVTAKRKEGQSQDDTNAGTSAIFEDVTAWPYSVDGAALLQDITNIIQRFTVLSIEQARACALWISFTWFIDGAKVAPMINITSPEKRCGKSTLLVVINGMVFKPLLASNITGAALFRSIELWTPTLLIDETDTFLNEKDDIRGILNAGHYRKTAFVIRTVGDSHEPKKFMTWCAKVLCGIGKIAHTLTDRSIVIELRRKLVNETVENIHLADESEFAVIRQKLKRWYEDNSEHYRAIRPLRIEGINDRAADNWQPLQSVAELAGGDWPRLCKHTAITLSGIEEETPSINVELLMDIADIFHDRGVSKIFTADLLEALCHDEDKQWLTWNRGKPITAHQVSKRLSEFGISPKDIRIGQNHKKGYDLQPINEAIIRYKPMPSVTPPQSATPRQPNDTNAYSDFNKRDTSNSVADTKTLDPLINKACRGVADRNPIGETINGCHGEVIL
jgi:putative DNA primase/helicase